MFSERQARLNRIGSVISLVASVIWIQWPLDFEQANPFAVLAGVGAFTLWLAVEFTESGRRPGRWIAEVDDDIDKLNKLLKIIDFQQFYVLKNQSIQTYMDYDDFRGLKRLVGRQHDDLFPFKNEKIAKLYAEFCEGSAVFLSDFFTLYSSDGRGSLTWRRSDDDWVEEDIYEQIMAKISVLNSQATSLAQVWERLIHTAREELKDGSIRLDPYEML